jgi:hypothetical protein
LLGDDDDDFNCCFRRKLCVTCSERDGARWIRVQTNSFPSHCFLSDIKPRDNDIDFETYYNPVFTNPPPTAVSLTTLCEIDAQLCNWKWPGKSSPLGLIRLSGCFDGVVGVSFTGVPIFDGTDERDEDPFYPSKGHSIVKHIDYCLGDVNKINPFYHFYSFSPCMEKSIQKLSDTPRKCEFYEDCATDTKSYMVSGVEKKKTPIGLALDGHHIYGPWKDECDLWGPCDVDVCNGFTDTDGVYAYATTNFHPYTIGCWGPGNKQSIYQSCSLNGKRCCDDPK